MKKTYFLILLLIGQFSANAQKMASDYYDDAMKYSADNRLEAALNAYNYIVKYHPRNELYARSFYEIGFINFLQKDYVKAKDIFKTILNSPSNMKDKVGGKPLVDTFIAVKEDASKWLSEIYYQEKEYDSALHYFALSDTAYPYHDSTHLVFTCGNAFEFDVIYKASRYSEIYQKLNKPLQAIKKLLSATFMGFMEGDIFCDDLRTLLKDIPNVKCNLDEALTKIYRKDLHNNNCSYKKYYFEFMDTEIPIFSNYGDKNQTFDKEKAINCFKSTPFYKMVEKL